MSCTAAFVLAEFTVGARYDTCTTVPFGTDDGRVRNTEDPLTLTPVGVTGVSPTNTVNALNSGVGVDFNDSLNVSVTKVPLAETVDSFGGAISGPAVELFVTDCAVSDTASFPEES
jgi:hypothetical protein